MFTWLGAQLAAILNDYVLGVVTQLITAITPIALSAMTLWVLFYGWAVLRNEVSETVPNFVWKTFKIGLVLAVALQSGVYITHVADVATGLSTGVATTFMPAGSPGAAATPYALLDQFNDQASQQVADIGKEMGVTRLDLLVAMGLFSVGSVAFLCVGVFIVTLATVLMTFVIAVGPVFILCLAWKPTQSYFFSWLSMLLSAAVLSWFAFFALGISAFVGDATFTAIQNAGGFLGTTLNVVTEATRFCVLMLVLAVLCFQAPGLASALTGGPAVQQGIQMLQNTMLVSRRSGGRGGVEGAAAAGGAIRGGAGLPHALGVATGRSAALSARTAGQIANGAGAVARGTYQVGRAAAYRLAALRGRS